MNLTLKNPAQFEKALERAVARRLEEKVRPMFHNLLRDAARILVTGDGGYAGTPQWSGNAAANWYLVRDGQAASFQEFFDTPNYPDDDTQYNGKTNQRAEAVSISLSRIESELSGSTAMKYTLVNAAPYLGDYNPYGSGSKFRLENMWPIGPQRAVFSLLARLKGGS